MNKKSSWLGWLGLGALLLSTAWFLYLGLTTRGTVDGGDSIYHYFHVERTTQALSSALRLWAKPFYTLVAAPAVALGGFTGLKVFNILSAMAALAGVSLIARKLGWKSYGLLPFLGLAAAAFPTYAFSGLTESFASLMLVATILALLYERPALAYLLASLLPYCRSEAKILLPLFLLYGLYHRHFRELPLLAAGSLIFSLLGAYYLDDWAWIFESPYQLDSDYYGHGSWLHYLEQLQHMLYAPLTALTAIGALLGLYRAWQSPAYRRRTWLLVHLPALAILAGHTTVWALGIYASAGLARVLVLVLPLFFLITLEGLETLYHWSAKLNKTLGIGLVIILVALCAWMPYERGIPHYYWKTALERSPRHKLVADSIAPYIEAHYAPFDRLVSDEPYLGMALGINMVDSKRIKSWRLMAHDATLFNRAQDLLLWDNRWLAKLKPGPAELAQDPCWEVVKKWAIKPLGKRQEFILYERAPACQALPKAD
ncbi:MAG: hypothetical protein RI565_07250 [Schleiferiaceae bacterium]|nr:hypothetical protein [Schleiferiaceae bacterium]